MKKMTGPMCIVWYYNSQRPCFVQIIFLLYSFYLYTNVLFLFWFVLCLLLSWVTKIYFRWRFVNYLWPHPKSKNDNMKWNVSSSIDIISMMYNMMDVYGIKDDFAFRAAVIPRIFTRSEAAYIANSLFVKKCNFCCFFLCADCFSNAIFAETPIWTEHSLVY